MIRARRHRLRIIGLLLLVLVARAWVPAGFMPGGSGATGLVLCPDGMLMPSDPADAGQGHGQDHVDHCPFGSAPFAAPLAHVAVTPALAAAISIPGPSASPSPAVTRPARSHQARGPPALSIV